MTLIKAMLLSALLGMLAACSGGGGSAPLAPAITVNPTALSFAVQSVGSPNAEATVTVINSGSAALTVASTQISGATDDFAAFNACTSVAPGGSCAVRVRFKPTTAGTLTATLAIASNASSGTTTVALTGQAVTTPLWTTLAMAPPAAVRLCLLLTDATVLCQSGQTWYRLAPSSTGSYAAGTWSLATSFSSSYIPDAFASVILADGRLAIIGGEYTYGNGSWNFALSNMGAIYDPVTTLWQALDPPPATGTPNHWQCIGDAPSSILADGRWVIGSKLYQDVAALNPTTLLWSAVTAPGKIDTINSEEGWTLMPDGSVLAVDVSSAPNTERLVLASGSNTGSWISAGQTPEDLHTPTTVTSPLNAPGCPPYNPPGEMGPVLLLPSGNVFAVGADGLTAVYGASTQTWSAGPAAPPGYNAQDGPGAVLPSGHVFFDVSPGAEGLGLVFYEFDGTALLATPLPQHAQTDATYFTSLLPLPSGEVLFVDESTTVQIYAPAVAPTYDPVWAPTISAAPSAVAAGSTYQVTGTQFNGLTQASAFGDEFQNATGYPLVRITNQATGHVVYAHTHDHSTMGVATGGASVSTYFDVPMAIESGASALQVVANGIPSAAVAVTVSGVTP